MISHYSQPTAALWKRGDNNLSPSRPISVLNMAMLCLAVLFLPLLLLGAMVLAVAGAPDLAIGAMVLAVAGAPDLAIAAPEPAPMTWQPALIAGTTVVSAEVKKLFDDLNKAFEDFKNGNDERLKQIESKGSADAALVNRVENANNEITKLQGQIRALETAQARVPAGGGDVDATRAELKAAREFVAMRRSVRPDEVTDKQVDLDEYRAYKSAFNAMLRRGDKAVSADIQNALSVGSNPEGGYWVPPDTSGRIIEFINETSPMRNHAAVQETMSNELEGWTDLDEVDTNKVGEQEARTGNTGTADLGAWKIPVHEIDAEPRATQRMLDMSIRDVEGWLAQKVGRRIGRRENTAFVVGSGVGEARGFTTYPAGTPTATVSGWPVIQQTNSGAAADFHATNPGDVFIDVMHALKKDLRAGAIWAMNSLTLAKVRKFKDGQGNYLWIPSLQAGTSGLLLGHGVEEFADMADVAAGALAVAFANFREGYQIVDGVGIRTIRDNLTTKGWVKFYTTKRYGGDVVNFEAIKLIKIAA
jgi:HK97 family phage major capsid protein